MNLDIMAMLQYFNSSPSSISEDESSEFLSESTDSDCNVTTELNIPRKKRYKKAIRHGLSKERAYYRLANKMNTDDCIETGTIGLEQPVPSDTNMPE